MDPALSTSRQYENKAPLLGGVFFMVPYQQQLGHKLTVEDGLWTVTLYQLREALKQALTVNGISSCETVCKLDGERSTITANRSKHPVKLF